MTVSDFDYIDPIKVKKNTEEFLASKTPPIDERFLWWRKYKRVKQ